MPSRRTFLSSVAAVGAVRSAQVRAVAQATPPHPSWLAPHVTDVGRLMASGMKDTHAWDRLAELCDTFGGRLTGSRNFDLATEWAAETMRRDGLDAVRLEKTMAPRWVRGLESLDIVEPVASPLVLLGLGGSVATPPAGITAPLLIVRSFDELAARGNEARGRIVLFDVPYNGYSATVVYRTTGASVAARHGALAVLVRSVGPIGLRTPHTGAMTYAEGTDKIPAAAIPVEDAQRLARLVGRDVPVTVRLTMQARTEADVPSANVVGEIRGRERPEEVVLIGGHFDSWDAAGGASDDGAGCVVTWEAARLIRSLGLQPRRTIRVVLFTNEENGLRGALAYRDTHAADASRHVLALEADTGVFDPIRLGFTGNERARQQMSEVVDLLAPLGLPPLVPGGGGADIGPIAQAGQVPTMALQGDTTRYFQIHHTPADTVERIDPREMARASTAIAVVTWVAADMAEPLPR